jgi:signal transduction histidine kinase
MSNAVLLVEDNQSHAELVTDELLEALPTWTIDVAPTLAEARRRIQARSYDLFVLDFRLPDGDGIEMLREIRARQPETPALFVTTASSTKLAVDAMKLGADDYIVKEEGYLSVLPYLVGEVLNRRRLAAEHRMLEERLLRAERAATLGYLASGLAHHINNPLATIRTFLQLLPTRYDDAEFRTRYLEMALAESERIRDLVRDIMRATTVPVEGRELQDVRSILHRAREQVASAAEAKGLTWQEDVPTDLPPVRVHGEAATCLFVSLVQNAVRFSPEGETIEISARPDQESGHVVVTIRDHGPGIPPEHRDKVFEPFFTTAVDGLGMGLFVASRIADLQEIRLATCNGVPNGAVFSVGVPIALQEEKSMKVQRALRTRLERDWQRLEAAEDYGFAPLQSARGEMHISAACEQRVECGLRLHLRQCRTQAIAEATTEAEWCVAGAP